MRCIVFSFFSASVLAAAPLAGAPAPPVDTTAYDQWFTALRAAALDPARGAEVHDLGLVRNQGTLRFVEGRIQLLTPVEDRTWGAVFVGRGVLTLDPPIPVERARAQRVYGSETVEREFRTAALVFTDATLAELEQALTWDGAPGPSSARKPMQDALEYVTDDKGWVSRDLMVPLLDGGAGLFYAFVDGGEGDPMALLVNPYDFEEVSLLRPAKGRGKHLETVLQFHKVADYESGSSMPQEALDLVVVDRYDITTTISKGLELRGRTAAHLSRLAARHDWVPFALHPDLEVDSVAWSGGASAPFARGRDGSDVWVDISGIPADAADLVFHYHGKIMQRPQGGWVQMETTTDWYPEHQYGRAATYRMTFTVPDDYDLAAVGRLVSEEKGDKTVTRVYETPVVHQVTFNIGEFQTTEIPAPTGPRLQVQVSRTAHTRVRDELEQRGILLAEQSDMAGVVGSDLRTSFAFFDQAFGSTTVDEFTATEVPYMHGEAYPGLVLLSLMTFQTTDRSGRDEMFRAHEVAHQWWGIGVRPATYHDRWIAEGFAEFAGLWYMARVRGSADLYRDRLEERRKEIIGRRDDAAPIWLGTRVASSRHPEDYETVVYGKGAWVLHMLRMLLTDYDGGGEDVFDAIMHDFYSSHLGKAATTEQFQQTIEERVGQSMQWFFDDWVYGSAIPTYTFSHRLEEQPDGSWKARLRVRQEKVPEDFHMVVPVMFDFGDKGTAVVRLLVAGPVTEKEFTLPAEPDGVEFNAFQAVLAETKTEAWR